MSYLKRRHTDIHRILLVEAPTQNLWALFLHYYFCTGRPWNFFDGYLDFGSPSSGGGSSTKLFPKYHPPQVFEHSCRYFQVPSSPKNIMLKNSGPLPSATAWSVTQWRTGTFSPEQRGKPHGTGRRGWPWGISPQATPSPRSAWNMKRYFLKNNSASRLERNRFWVGWWVSGCGVNWEWEGWELYFMLGGWSRS